MNVVPAQVAGVALDRARPPRRRRSTAACRTRRSWPPARCSASTRSTPSAARRRSRCSPTAPGRAARSTWSPGPATSTSSPPSGCSRAWSASTPRPARPRSPILADDTADAAYVAADLISQAEHDPMAAAVLVTASRAPGRRGRGRARQAGLRHPARRADPHRARRAASPAIVLVDDLEQGLDGGQRLRRRAPRDPDRRRRATCAARVRNAGRDLRRPVRPGVARRLLRRLQPRAADRRLRLPLLAGCRCASFLKAGARRRLHPRRARRGRRPRRRRWPRPRTCPVTARRCASGSTADVAAT